MDNQFGTEKNHVDARAIFKPLENSTYHGIKFLIWVLRLLTSLDAYQVKIVLKFLTDGHLPPDILEAFIMSDRRNRHLVDRQVLFETFEFEGRQFSILHNELKGYYHAVDSDKKSFGTHRDLNRLKQDIRWMLITNQMNDLQKLRQRLSDALTVKSGKFCHNEEVIRKYKEFEFSQNKIRDDMKRIDVEIARVTKVLNLHQKNQNNYTF